MKPFMDKDFILNTETAKELYHETAAFSIRRAALIYIF